MPVIKQYFNESEVVFAKNKKDWFKKIDYYMKDKEKRKIISEKAYQKVMKYHTYHNRAKQIIGLYEKFKKENEKKKKL